MNLGSKLVILAALTSSGASAHPQSRCGELEVRFDDAVVIQDKTAQLFARARVFNRMCRSAGFALQGNAKSGFWLYDDQFTR